MTQADIRRSIDHLNALVLEGRMMEAFEAYYDNDVVMQENDLQPTVSKEANRIRELAFLANVVAFRSATILGVGVKDNQSFVLWRYDYDHKEWGLRKYTQVSVQEWRNGKIIFEKFIYN